MGCSQRFHIKPFAIGSSATVESFTIPRCRAGFVIAWLFSGIEPTPGNLIRLANQLIAAAKRNLSATINWAAFAGEWVSPCTGKTMMTSGVPEDAEAFIVMRTTSEGQRRHS